MEHNRPRCRRIPARARAPAAARQRPLSQRSSSRQFNRQAPWPQVENVFTRALTDLGFGSKFTAEFARDGETFHKPFVVEQGPPHYNAADKFKSEVLGMTLRDLTYEVRRQLQKLPEDPGVVVAKIESGEKAAIAGIRPYELITHVNGEPVTSVDQFEEMIKDQEEVRLSVLRLRQGRMVKIRLAER